MAGARETSKSLARFRLRRRKIQAFPGADRTRRSSSAKNPRDWHGTIKGGTGSVRRSRKKNRSEQVADRGFQANPKRTSPTAKSHPRRGQRSGQDSQI